MNGKFTEKAEKAVKLSQESAVRMGHSYGGPSICCSVCLKRVPELLPGCFRARE